MGNFTPRHFTSVVDPNGPDPDTTPVADPTANSNTLAPVVATTVVDPLTVSQSTSSTTQSTIDTTTTVVTDSQLSAAEQIVNEHWMKSFWRPMMAYLYMIICFMDFVGFPLISMVSPIILKGFGIQSTYIPWVPLSLTNGGLVHMTFLGVLGISAWTRGKNTNT